MPSSSVLASRPKWLGSQQILFAIAAAALALQAALVPLMSVNWDEFRFLADVHQLARHELTAPVQTFHAHLFLWLTLLPFDEIGQIIAGRGVMFALECMTALLIYRCAREFADGAAAAFALICYLTLTFVMRHGSSFRFDPPSTFLLMSAVTLVLVSKGRSSLAFVGVAVALAALITIKSVFYVPTIAALAWYRWRTSRNPASWLASLGIGAACGVITLGLLYAYHRLSLAPDSMAAQNIVSSSVGKTIGQSHFMPRADALLQSVMESPINWTVMLAGIYISLRELRSSAGPDRARLIALLSLALPLSTLGFYRNAFPYYFAFMLAPVSVLCVAATPLVVRIVRLEIAGAAMLLFGTFNALAQPFAILPAQKSVVSAVHQIFPAGTPYIDRCSMIASLPKHGIFMSTWGVEVYRDSGEPIYRKILTEHQPRFVLANSSLLETALTRAGEDQRMLQADAKTLRENYVHHWGPIWVAGKTLQATTQPRQFEVLLAGQYPVGGTGPVEVDGQRRRPGDVIILGQGIHTASRVPAGTTLRWGRNLPVPIAPGPTEPLFGNL